MTGKKCKQYKSKNNGRKETKKGKQKVKIMTGNEKRQKNKKSE